MKRSLAHLFLFFVLCSACHKNNDPTPGTGTGPDPGPNPAPVVMEGTGNISGVCDPLGSISYIVASATVNGQTVTRNTNCDQNGKFVFNDLPTGAYTLSFTVTSARYVKPADKTVTVVRAQNTDVGTIKVPFNADNGSISGAVSPAGATFHVSISGQAPNVTVNDHMSPDPATGFFKLTDLPPGSYTLSFIAANGFISPSNQTVTVTARQNTDLGTMTFDQYGKITSLSCKVNGTVLSLTGTTSYLSDHIEMLGSYYNGPPQEVGTYIYHVILRLDNITAPGTYTYNSNSTSTVTYSWSRYNYIATGGTWTSKATGASATVVITSIDPVAHTITGTFTGNLVGTTLSGTSTQVITDGAFTTTYK